MGQTAPVSWWCSALKEPWSWTWRAYPGVWLFLLGIGALYLRGVTRPGRTGDAPHAPVTRRQVAWFVSGLVVLWVALDWPIGTLGTGYLAFAHMIQYLLMVYVAPPLLLKGIPEWLARRVVGGGRFRRVLHAITRFLPAVLIATAVLLLTQMPITVDNLRGNQLGSFGLDLVWLVGGLLMWWPVRGPLEEDRFTDPVKMVYLFVVSVPALVPAGFLTWATFPIYRLYELAPQVGGITDTFDQQLAGAIMKVGGDLWLWGWIAVIWVEWSHRPERAGRRADERAYRKVSEIPAAGPAAAGAAAEPATTHPAVDAEQWDDFHQHLEDWKQSRA